MLNSRSSLIWMLEKAPQEFDVSLFYGDGDSGLITGDVNLIRPQMWRFLGFSTTVTLFIFPHSVHRNQVTKSSPHSGEVY